MKKKLEILKEIYEKQLEITSRFKKIDNEKVESLNIQLKQIKHSIEKIEEMVEG